MLARPTHMHSRKTLQKKETSAPIPKKYLEYAVSQGGVVRGSTLIETAHPGQPRGRAVLLGSLTLLLSNQVPFPNKISCFVSTCVSSDNSFPSVRQEPSFGPWKGTPSYNKPTVKNQSTVTQTATK